MKYSNIFLVLFSMVTIINFSQAQVKLAMGPSFWNEF